MGTQSKLKKNMLRLILISIAGTMIYGLPYFRSYYYDAYLQTYGLTNSQMGMFGSIFGIMGACSYLFGGVVADMFSARKLMTISMILTGLGGLLHLMHPSYLMLVGIYFLWGFTSLFAFWPALLKVLRSLANEDEQSKAYGFMDATRGITNAVQLAVTLAIFNALSKKASDLAGLNGVVIFYSAICIVMGIGLYFVLDEKKLQTGSDDADDESKFSFAIVKQVLKMPVVWLLSLVVCCSYTMPILFYYFTPYATANLGMTAAAGAMVTMLAQYVRPVACVVGGVAADKIGRANVMYGTMGIMLASTLVLIFARSMANAVFIGICACIYFGMYGAYSLVFSMFDECGIPKYMSGTAIGLICTIGYMPEFFCPLLAGKVLDTYGNAGYHILFIFLAVMMVIGLILLTFYKRLVKKM
ncbi:MAG: MFS transporter [Mogibacterium sp.]|uniref:MFS transporter n=1 Tax=Mogibacterium sp. TaxID=2049035 RepID=UPI001A3D9DC4|nr:MFS transporter [Mogibacterium sp.]MBL6468172.1 MFS transporter [Mogibacterium sp.]